jgi:hypothetical protein
VHRPILVLRELDGPDETAFERVTLAAPNLRQRNGVAATPIVMS